MSYDGLTDDEIAAKRAKKAETMRRYRANQARKTNGETPVYAPGYQAPTESTNVTRSYTRSTSNQEQVDDGELLPGWLLIAGLGVLCVGTAIVTWLFSTPVTE